MKLIILGPPGAGKGTQADFIAAQYGVPKISTGDMLRSAVKAGTTLGREAKRIMDAGGLVSDDIIMGVIQERLKEPDCKAGYLFDGFPRTIGQAEALGQLGVKVDGVVELKVPDEAIVNRMSGRRVHPRSGRTYHLVYNPPRNSGVDDETGEPIIQRIDDKEETVRHRLTVYHQQTSPLVDFYRQQATQGKLTYIEVDGNGTLDGIRDSISVELGKIAR